MEESMAPEYFFGNLVVLDLQMNGSAVKCKVDRLDQQDASQGLHVSWNATECPAGAQSFGNGAVFVWRPQGGYYRRKYHSAPDILDGKYSWVHYVQGDVLMLVLVFPSGYVLPDVDAAQPTFVRCKELVGQDRMVLYWMLERQGQGVNATTLQVDWEMDSLKGRNFREHLASLNDEVSKRISPWNAIVGDFRGEGSAPLPPTFIIHGHDDEGVGQLKSALSEMGIEEMIVMKERLVSGASLVEKFEQLAGQAGFAAALLTPDDLGGLVSGQDLSSRARQNTWLEIGWFWGRLGRDRLMLLVKGEVEIPSDLKGIVYIEYRDSVQEVVDKIRQFYEAHKVPLKVV
jgi:hypothetical protein